MIGSMDVYGMLSHTAKRKAMLDANETATSPLKSRAIFGDNPLKDLMPQSRMSMMVHMDKQEMDHLEREEKKTMKLFTRTARRMGTMKAIDLYLKDVDKSNVGPVVERFATLKTEESSSEDEPI